MMLSFDPSRAAGFCLAVLVQGFLSSASADGLRVAPTYENAGVYVEAASGAAPESLRVFYREAGAGDWLPAHALTASKNDPVPRGSLFGLRQDTAYEVECRDAAGKSVASASFKTWADRVPVARTINIKDLAPDGGPVLIDAGGRPDGWVRYVADPGFVIQGGDVDEEAVLLEDVQYVILDGLTIRGGRRHGIQLRKSQNIRILNCDIAGFGRVGVQDFSRKGQFFMPGEAKSINWDAGIYVDLSGNLTIERNYIHDPRGRANSWFYSHPAGPTAILVRSTGGMVVRHNDFVGSEKHRWNDVIEGYGNEKPDGGFNRDSDIYGNYLAYANDDGIELDGSQCNVRFYGNKIEGGLCGVSTAPNVRGPSYVFNNLVANLGEERGAGTASVKNGGGPTYSKGTTYFYHNTFFTLGGGVTATGFGGDRNRGMFFGHTRNNIFATSGPGINDGEPAPGNTYEHDIFARPEGGPGAHDIPAGMAATGRLMGVRFADPARGDFRAADADLPKPVALDGFSALQAGATAPGITARSMPDRPTVPFEADASQIMLYSVAGSEASAVLTLKSLDSKRDQAFTLRKNDAADWLLAEPASGVIPAGGEVKITVSLAAGQAGRGLLLGALMIRTPEGDSRPVTVYGLASVEKVRRLFEAESLPGAGDFPSRKDEKASGGAYVDFNDEAAGKSGKGSKALTVPIELASDGAIYVAYRIRAPKPYGNHDSMFVALDGQPARLTALTVSESWQWTRLTGEAMHLKLSAGSHALKLIPREGVDIDAVLVSDRPLMAGDSPDSASGGN